LIVSTVADCFNRSKNVCRPEIGPKHFQKLTRNPARPEKFGPTYNAPAKCLNHA